MNESIAYIHRSLQHAMRLCCFAGLLLMFAIQGKSQQMHFHLVVENEFAVTNLRNPDFGVIPPGSGWVLLPVESEQAGFFTISTTENVQLIASITVPERLVMNPSNSIPFRLEAAYVCDGITNPTMAKPFENKRASFTPSTRGVLIDENYTWLRELKTNVFLYGAVYVGDVEPGVYYGEVVVSLEYL